MLRAPASKVRRISWYLAEKLNYEAEEAHKQQEELDKERRKRERRERR